MGEEGHLRVEQLVDAVRAVEVRQRDRHFIRRERVAGALKIKQFLLEPQLERLVDDDEEVLGALDLRPEFRRARAAAAPATIAPTVNTRDRSRSARPPLALHTIVRIASYRQ